MILKLLSNVTIFFSFQTTLNSFITEYSSLSQNKELSGSKLIKNFKVIQSVNIHLNTWFRHNL